jgi:hypothetical protein
MVLAVPIIPLACAAFPASCALLCWSLENCTGSERDRPRRHVLICRFGASPGEPQPSMAATNKCLAQSNKSRTRVPATKKREINFCRMLTDAIRTAKGKEGVQWK